MKLYIFISAIMLQIIGCGLLYYSKSENSEKEPIMDKKISWFGGMLIILFGLVIFGYYTLGIQYFSANMPTSQAICDEYTSTNRPPLNIKTEDNWKHAISHCDFTQKQFCSAFECNKKINPKINFFENDCTEYTIKNKMINAIKHEYDSGIAAQRFSMNPDASHLPSVPKTRIK